MITVHRFYPLPAGQQGIAAVEFALTVMVLLVMVGGIAEIGRAFWYYDAISKGTRDAARHFSVIPTAALASAVAPTAGIVTAAAQAAGVPGFSSNHVTVVCAPVACGTALVGTDITRVTVSVNYPLRFGLLFPLHGARDGEAQSGAATLTPHTTMPYMW